MKSVLLILTLTVVTACEYYELRGFVSSYETADQRFEQSMEWNKAKGYTSIHHSQQHYTLYAMSDSHVGTTRNLTRFFDAAQSNALAALLVGDLTTGKQADYEVFSSHLPADSTFRYFALAGNHDIYFDGWKHYKKLFGTSTYYFSVNTPNTSDLFICLDSSGGTLGSLQLEWFRTVLETMRNNYRHCVVFTHNNLLRFRPTMSTNPYVEEVQVLLDLFLRHRVGFAITGHDHISDSATFGSTTHITMDALLDKNKQAGYLKLMIREEGIEFRFERM